MKNAKKVFNQINKLTSDLVGTPICSDQNYPIQDGPSWDTCRIDISNSGITVALKNKPYRELFYELLEARSYNLKLLDGALVQLQYKFENDSLVSHRLAFFPNPDLSDFQNNSEEYLDDEIYLDIIDQRIVVTPLRFDYDNRATVARNIEHPLSHLTIGQYNNCRIPVICPLTPWQFISFIIRNFYHTAYNKYCDKLTAYHEQFEKTITEDESRILHLCINNAACS